MVVTSDVDRILAGRVAPMLCIRYCSLLYHPKFENYNVLIALRDAENNAKREDEEIHASYLWRVELTDVPLEQY